MRTQANLETRLTELLMSALAPCDLGDGIEVVHETESLEVEMECAVDDDEPIVVDETEKFELLTDDFGTHQFVRFSAPYERIEIQIDAKSFIRATIEEAKSRRGN